MTHSDTCDGLAHTLADTYSTFGLDDVAAELTEQLPEYVIDVIGNAYAGAGDVQHAACLNLIEQAGATGRARVIGTDETTSSEKAAFANSTAAHTIVQDDAHRRSGTHPGAVVVPAALALGEANQLPGKTVIEGVLAGYDAMGRTGSVQTPYVLSRYRRPTSVYGPIGAAITAGVLLNLSRDQLANAIGLAANFAGGLSQVWLAGTDEYALHAGFAAQAGINAATLARSELEVAPGTLEGDSGFYTAFLGERPSLDVVTDDLGARFEIRDVYRKAHPSCGVAIAPIQLATSIKSTGIDADDIEHVEIVVSRTALDIVGTGRTSGFDSPTNALMSIPFGVASVFVLGEYTRSACRDHHDDTELVSFLDRVAISEDETFPKYRCTLRVRLTDGTVIEREQDGPAAPSIDEIEEKFVSHAIPHVGEAAAHRLLERLWTIHETPDVSRVFDVL